MLLTGDRGGFRPQRAVDLAEIFLIQKRAAAAVQWKADVLAVKLHGSPELLAQRAGFCPIPPGGVFVDDHLPADAAAVGTVPRQTGKLVKIIRNTNQHGNPP